MPTITSSKREGNVRIRRKNDGTLTIEQDWHFRVRADSKDQDRVDILTTTSGLPEFGVNYDPYGMQVKGANAAMLDADTLLWDAVFTLSNQIEEGEDHDPSGNPQTGDPTSWTPIFTVGWEDYDEVFRESLPINLGETLIGFDDANGDPGTDPVGYNSFKWVNSAGRPYETGFVRQLRIPVRRFTQFEPIIGASAVTLDEIEERNDTLNDDTFLSKPKRTLRLMVEDLSVGFYYGVRCIRVDYAIAFNKRDWRLKQLDVGYYHKETSGDPNSANVAFEFEGNITPGALDGHGGKAADQLDPAIRYHKEFEDLHFDDFLRVIFY